MTADVEVRLKPKAACEGRTDSCSLAECPLYGTPLRANRDGRQRIKGCGDVVARNKRNRAKGDKKARQGRKALGLAGANTRHEELWGGPVRVESKAGAKAKPVMTAHENAMAQSELARPLGDTRGFMGMFAPDGTRHVYYTVRDDHLERVVFALAEAWGYGGAA